MVKVTSEVFLARIRDLRKEAGLTQEQVAELAELTYKHYQSIEAGRRKHLWLDTVFKLAQAYDLEVWELFYPSPPRLSPEFLKKIERGTKG